MIETQIQKAKTYIEEADAILITAGAGMGVDSGLPDFRGDEGFWKAYPVIKDLGIGFSQMANPEWFDTKPKLAWAFYGHRLHLYRDTEPHAGFSMLLDLVKQKNENYFIYTSNVDGQFQKAGFDAQKIVEVHGSIHHFQCTHNCSDAIWDAKEEEVPVYMKTFEALSTPKCKQCEEIARPNILMFGDWGWNEKRTDAQEHRFNKWLHTQKKSSKKIVIIEVGAGVAIPTIRHLGESLAKRDHCKLLRINPRDYDIDSNIGISLPFGGLEGIEKIMMESGNE